MVYCNPTCIVYVLPLCHSFSAAKCVLYVLLLCHMSCYELYLMLLQVFNLAYSYTYLP